MRLALILVAVCACARSTSQPQPIEAVNPVIGDISFIRAFGRFPTRADDPVLRARTHVAYVAAELRRRDVSALPPELRATRARMLDELDRYVAAGRFPGAETAEGRLPAFVDPRTGVRCAVADLVETTAGTDLMAALDHDHHNAFVAELAGDPRFAAWAARSGLTTEELAMIQPSYGPDWYRPRPEPAHDLDLGATSTVAIDAASPRALALAGGFLRWIGRFDPVWGARMLEIDGAGGWSDGAAYEAHARAGLVYRFEPDVRLHFAGFTIGAGIERFGDAVARTATFPLQGFYRFPIGERALAGIHGEVSADLHDGLHAGWVVGLELVKRDLFGPAHPADPDLDIHLRDLTLSLDAQGVGDAVFIGLSVALVARSAYGFTGRLRWSE